MIYMLDTNAVSHLFRERDGRMAKRLSDAGLGNIAISVVVLGELEYGVAWRGSDRLRETVDRFVAGMTVEVPGPEVAQIYGRIRAELKKAGQPIGPNDLWIAAHAMALDAILVTDNEREFSRITGLRTENWLR